MTAENLQRRRGIMTVTSGQIAEKMAITVISYQPRMENSPAELGDVITKTLDYFGLFGELVCDGQR